MDGGPLGHQDLNACSLIQLIYIQDRCVAVPAIGTHAKRISGFVPYVKSHAKQPDKYIKIGVVLIGTV